MREDFSQYIDGPTPYPYDEHKPEDIPKVLLPANTLVRFYNRLGTHSSPRSLSIFIGMANGKRSSFILYSRQFIISGHGFRILGLLDDSGVPGTHDAILLGEFPRGQYNDRNGYLYLRVGEAPVFCFCFEHRPM